ncbi:MAG: hypothetical protein R2789_16285 [Microthrixaceae bacterium]
MPLLVAGAGLPSLPGLAGEARSYAERLFSYVEVDSLSGQDARRALVEPVESEGAAWDEEGCGADRPPHRGLPVLPPGVRQTGVERRRGTHDQR